MKRYYDDKTNGEVAVLDEYELHTLIVDLNNAWSPQSDEHGRIEHIKIVPTGSSWDPNEFTSELVDKWEQKVNDALSMLRQLDHDIHEDAEYTC